MSNTYLLETNSKDWSDADIADCKSKLTEAADLFFNTEKLSMTNEVFNTLKEKYEQASGEKFGNGAKPRGEISGLVDTAHEFEEFLGSLNKVKANDGYRGVLNFLSSANADRLLVCVSQKADGNSIAFTWDMSGELTQAITRGDDGVGKDLTSAFKDAGGFDVDVTPEFAEFVETFSAEEKAVSFTFKFEAVCLWDDFAQLTDYKTPRAYVSGRLGAGHDKLVQTLKDGIITFVMLTDGLINGSLPIDFEEADMFFEKPFIKVKRQYFDVDQSEFKSLSDTITEIGEDIAERRLTGGETELYTHMMTDGLVLEILTASVRQKLGWSSNCPNYAMAYKFPPMEAETECVGFRFDHGKSTGRYTPVIQFKTVTLNGCEYSNVSLANYKRWEELQPINVGTRLVFTLQNDTLGYIEKLECEENKLIEPFKFPESCRFCETELEVNDKRTFIRCPNTECPSLIAGQIYNWLSKVGVKNIGRKTIERICEVYQVDSVADIYKFEVVDLLKVDRFADRSAEEFIRERDKITKLEDWKLLGSLSILGIGRSKSKELLRRIRLKEIMILGLDDYTQFEKEFLALVASRELKNFAEGTSKQLYDGLLLKKELIADLLEMFEVECTWAEVDKSFVQKKICITGSLNKFENRGELKKAIEAKGHKVSSGVSKNTDFLINNDITSVSGKNGTAKELKIPIYSEEEAIEILDL